MDDLPFRPLILEIFPIFADTRSAMKKPSTLLALGFVSLVFLSGCGSQNGSSPSSDGILSSAFERGLASWYGEQYQGKRTASGEIFDMNQLTAAHRTLPFGTLVEVERLDNGRRVQVRINDRGPSVDGRIIDLSRRAADQLAMLQIGVAEVLLKLVNNP